MKKSGRVRVRKKLCSLLFLLESANFLDFFISRRKSHFWFRNSWSPFGPPGYVGQRQRNAVGAPASWPRPRALAMTLSAGVCMCGPGALRDAWHAAHCVALRRSGGTLAVRNRAPIRHFDPVLVPGERDLQAVGSLALCHTCSTQSVT